MLNTFLCVKNRWSTLFLWLYWATLATVFVGGSIVRFSLSSTPFIDSDIGYYLQPAIQKFTNHVYATQFRFIYPTFVTLVLWIFQNLTWLAYVQHILGIGTAALIVFIFFRSRVFLPSGKLLDWAVRITALTAAYLFLFSRSTITLEHSIRPEALFPTACGLTMLAGLEFSRRVFLEKHTNLVSSIWMLLLIIFAIGTYYLKPAWGFAAGTSLSPLLLALVWIPGKWLWKLGLPLLGFLLAFFIFVLTEHLLQNRSHENKAGFLSETLLCTHAEFLQDIMERDALRMAPESEERAYLLQFVQDIHSAILNPSLRRYGLSLNPDDLMHRGPLENLKEGLKSYHMPFNQFCYYYYFRAWSEHPFAMLKKIFSQMEFFYSPEKQNIYDKSNDLKLGKNYEKSVSCFPTIQHPYWQPIADYQKNVQNSYSSKEDEFIIIPNELHRKKRTLLLFLNGSFFPLFILSFIGAVIVFLSGNYLANLRPAAFVALYFDSFNLANCLTISIIHMMQVSRYHFNQITMSLVSQGFEILFLIALIIVCFRNWKSSYPNNLK